MIQERENEYQELQRIQQMRGRHTSLITYLISKDTNIWLSNSKFKTELKTASNIKDKTNRQNVQGAWRSIISLIKTIKTVPDNGMAMFVGTCLDVNGHYVWRNDNYRTTKTNPTNWI